MILCIYCSINSSRVTVVLIASPSLDYSMCVYRQNGLEISSYVHQPYNFG